MQESGEKSYRQQTPPLRLVMTAIGTPQDVQSKLDRARKTLESWTNQAEIRRRFQALKDAGIIWAVPSPVQIAAGTFDSFRYFLVPSARALYRQKRVNFWFHQVLRWLDDPVSMLDPTGFLSERDTIIGHLLQVVHHDAIYDFQLLYMFPDGMDELERQLKAVLDGTHPRLNTLKATIEDPAYYPRLWEMFQEFRKDPSKGRLMTDDFFKIPSPAFWRAERTFSGLTNFVEYCTRLPEDPAVLARHLLLDREIPEELAVQTTR